MLSDICALIILYSCLFLVCVICAKIKLDRHRRLERCEWAKQAANCMNMLYGLILLEGYCCVKHMIRSSGQSGYCCLKLLLTIAITVIIYFIKNRPTIANHERCIWILIGYILFTLVYFGSFCGKSMGTDSMLLYGVVKNKIRGGGKAIIDAPAAVLPAPTPEGAKKGKGAAPKAPPIGKRKGKKKSSK